MYANFSWGTFCGWHVKELFQHQVPCNFLRSGHSVTHCCILNHCTVVVFAFENLLSLYIFRLFVGTRGS